MGYLKGKLNINYKGRDKWIEENTNKHLCACGCDGYIVVRKHHFAEGIPKYIHGHNSKTEDSRKHNSEWHKKRIGPLASRWIKDRNKVKGPRRWVFNFTKRQKRDIYYRDKGICQKCGIFTMIDANRRDMNKFNAHHIISIEDGGVNEISNGQTLCLICHKLIHSVKANRMNSGKPRTGNPEPSVQSTKVQRLPENSDVLNNRLELPTRKG